ncbi:MAG: hypothetical protein ACRDPQ_06580 [Nocardioidaceae bacterium]
MSTKYGSEAAWKAFFIAAITAGIGALVGMVSGLILGGLADAVIAAATGDGQVRYAFLAGEAGIYVGLFLGIAVGIGTGTTRRASAR